MAKEASMEQEAHNGNVHHEGETGRAAPDEHRIRQRAYEIWEEKGRPDGRARDHWLRARWEIEHESDPDGRVERLERELGHEDEPG